MGKDSSTPKAPNYEALASQQGRINQDAADRQTRANRPNQYSPFGSVTWTNNPTTSRVFNESAYNEALANYYKSGGSGNGGGGGGNRYSNLSNGQQDAQDIQASWVGDGSGPTMDASGNPVLARDPLVAPNRDDFYSDVTQDNWTQTTTLDPADQARLDAQRALLGGAQGAVGSALSKPFSLDGIAQPGELNYDGLQQLADPGFGAVQQVQSAMMSRLNPALEQGRDREVQRLKAQGITEGSPAWQAAMRSLNEKDVDANNQALLGATSAYGDIFNRTLANRQQGVAERGNVFNAGNQTRARLIQELLLGRTQPLNEYQALIGGQQVGMPQMSGFMGAAGAAPANQYGAGTDAYRTALNQANANAANNVAAGSGIGGLLGGIVGSFVPGIGTAAGAAIGSGIGGAVSR